jgi:hypothetical protein
LNAVVFVAPLPSLVTVALIWLLLGSRMTAARIPAVLVGAALLSELINHGGEQWYTARSRPGPTKGRQRRRDNG